MNRLREVIDQSLLEAKQPQVVSELCVHSMYASASCTACVAACPLQAWILDDSELGLDTSLCDGCGLCIPACPQGAIQPLHQPVIYHWDKRDIALAACERAGLDEAEGVVPCVHGVGVRDLLILYGKGIRDFMLTSGDCSQCDRGIAPRLDAVIVNINRMLEQRGLLPIRYYQHPPELWVYTKNTAMTPSKGPEIGRRNFLRRAVGMVAKDQSLHQKLSYDKEVWATPPGQMIPSGGPESIQPFNPAININSCNGCDVCVRLCPHNTIKLDLGKTGNEPSYTIHPDSCSGCMLCVDGCDVNAVSVIPWGNQQQQKISLVQARCRACGADYHVPQASQQIETGLCRVCSVSNHHSKLYQVME